MKRLEHYQLYFSDPIKESYKIYQLSILIVNLNLELIQMERKRQHWRLQVVPEVVSFWPLSKSAENFLILTKKSQI